MVLKVGFLAGFVVLKSLPDYDAYLCKLIDSQFLALLPKKWARKEYRVGESGWAAVFDMKGPRITLSQKSPQYVRKILEYLLLTACTELRLRIKKVARVDGYGYHKVAVEPLKDGIMDSAGLQEALGPYLKEIDLKEYFSEKISFVRYSRNLREYVVNALCPPGNKSGILRVIHHEEMNKVDVLAESTEVGRILGIKGKNAFSAAKLCQCEIEVRSISLDTYKKYEEVRAWKKTQQPSL